MIWFMEELLRIEADIKYFVGMKDRSYQRWLMDELLKILEEAEFFGPRDRSYEPISVLASQSILSWNRIICWLKEMENLRKLLPEVSDLPLTVRIES